MTDFDPNSPPDDHISPWYAVLGFLIVAVAVVIVAMVFVGGFVGLAGLGQ